ncbi:hypothetical protein Tco_0107256 [Tanacetum coccineum]
MGDENLDTIPATESDEVIKSSVDNLVPIPSESEDFSDIEIECDVPDCDDSQTKKISPFSNPLFDDSTSSDDESSHEEIDFLLDEFAGELTRLQSIPPGIEYLCFNAESDLLESLLHRDTSINDSQKIDSPLDKFTGELTLLKSIPPGIDDVNLNPEEDIFFLESLLYDNSYPHPSEEI